MKAQERTSIWGECSTVYEIGGGSEGKEGKAKLYSERSENAQIRRLVETTDILGSVILSNLRQKE